MNAGEAALIELATAKFPKLTDAQKRLLQSIANGKFAEFGDEAAPSRTISANIIRWLCVDPEAIRYIDPKGIRLDSAKIEGTLDLNSVNVPVPLILRRCAICAGISLERAETRFLSFEDSYTRPIPHSPYRRAIAATGLIVHGTINLCDGFRAEGEVGLYGAVIDGDLMCRDACFENADGRALSAGGATVKGAALLHNFRANGEVNLYRTKINGDLNCDGSLFRNPGKEYALNVGAVEVGGTISLRKSRVEGRITLYGAKIEGDLICDCGIFINPGVNKFAMGAGAVTVGGTVSLRDTCAEGQVGLYRGNIGSDLRCDGGIFLNPGGRALSAGGASVGGAIQLRNGFQAIGEVNLYGAKISGNLACDGGIFLNPNGRALAAGGITVGGAIELRDGFEAMGEVGLYSGRISGNLACDGGHFLNAGNRALNASLVTVGGRLSLCKSTHGKRFRAEGEVGLYKARIGSDLTCDGGIFLNPGGRALGAGGATVGGAIELRYGFQAMGEVGLYSARISGNLTCDGGIFVNAGKRALNAGAVIVGGSVFLRSRPKGENFRAEGEVGLYETRITGMLDCTGGHFLNPGKDKYALNARAVVVGGDTRLGNGFQARGLVRLTGASIGTHLELFGAEFVGEPSNGLLADKIVVKGLFDWRKVTCTNETVLNLWGARVGQLADDKKSWPRSGKLDLDDFIYTAIVNSPVDAATRKYWLERQASQPPRPQRDREATRFRPSTYQQLAKVLHESGHEAEAKRILIAKERARARQKYENWRWHMWLWRIWPWLGNRLFLDLGMAYGYEPQRLLVLAGVFVLAGGVLFGAGYKAGTIIPAKKVEENTRYPSFDPWMYSLDTLLPIINFGQKDYWWPEVSHTQLGSVSSVQLASLAPHDPKTTKWWTSVAFLRVYRWVHIGIGWLLITLGIAGVTGLVRKE